MAGYRMKVISLTKRPGHTFGFYLRVENGEDGHLIRCLEMGGPAELAGMKDGDRILRVNGAFVDELTHSEVVDMVRNSGASVTFHILDKASYLEAKAQGVTFTELPASPVANGSASHALKPKLCHLVKSKSGYGFALRSVNGQTGLFMTEVIQGGVAHAAGVKVNDRLVELNGKRVEDYTHDQVVDHIKLTGGSLMFLLVDKETDQYYKNKGVKIQASQATVEHLQHKPHIIDVTQGSDGYGFLLREEQNQTGHFIKNIERSSPAAKAGLKEKDRLVAVNGNDVDGYSHNEVVEMIRQCGNKCSFFVVDKVTDQMFQQSNMDPMLFYEDIKAAESPPSYIEAINLPSPVKPSTSKQVEKKEELKPKLCKMEKSSAGFGFHLNGIQGVCGQYIKEVVEGGAADRAGLKDDDIVVEVNGVNAEEKSHEDVVEMIRSGGSSLEMLVASQSVYDQLKAKGTSITRLLLGETSYAQVHAAETPQDGEEERRETTCSLEVPTEAARERASSSSSQVSVDIRL